MEISNFIKKCLYGVLVLCFSVTAVFAAPLRNYVCIVRSNLPKDTVTFLEEYRDKLENRGYAAYAKNIDRFLDGDIFRLYRTHELYSLSIEKYALSHGVQYIDMRMAMLEAKDYRSLMCKDGIHPNASGYAYMADVWIRELPRLHKEF